MHLYAFAYGLAKHIPHVAMTDGTDVSEKGLSKWHRTVRRHVYARSAAFVSASSGGRRLRPSYGVADEACFHSCLCIDNAVFATSGNTREQHVDFLFCGRIEPVKNPMFAFEVALHTTRRLGRKVSILFVGAGDQEEALRTHAAQHAAGQCAVPGLCCA